MAELARLYSVHLFTFKATEVGTGKRFSVCPSKEIESGNPFTGLFPTARIGLGVGSAGGLGGCWVFLANLGLSQESVGGSCWSRPEVLGCTKWLPGY